MSETDLYDVAILDLHGKPLPLTDYRDRLLLIVNVASKCGLTPQYAGLEALHEQYTDRGLTVLGVPCNQFYGQEPGTAEEIAEFCSTTYGVTFPLEQSDYKKAKREVLNAFNRKFIEFHLRANDYNIFKTAQAIGYNRENLSELIRELGIDTRKR